MKSQNQQTSSSIHPLRAGLLTAALFCAAICHAQTPATATPASPWSVSLGLGVAAGSEYEGGSKRVTGVVPDLDIRYKTANWGSFGIGAKSRGASWTIIDKDEYSFGIAIGGDTGRVDNKDGSLFRPGSKRLQGMGSIDSGLEYGVFGHVTLGVPLSLQIMRGSGDGKPKGADLKIDGHGGVHATFAAEIPWKVNDALSFSLSPHLVWANQAYTQTYFGVTAAQSARSGFKAYNAKGGVKTVGVSIGGNYAFTKNWSLNAGVSLDQLRGDAAKSPIVQKKSLNSASLGIAYTF
jgi:MipA family protein